MFRKKQTAYSVIKLYLYSIKPQFIYFIVAVALILFTYAPFLYNGDLKIFDWLKESYFYFFLKQSLIEYKLLPNSFILAPPIIAWYPTLTTTASFIGNPEILFFSPTLLLLPFFSVSVFFKLHFVIHGLIGAWGIYKLGEHFKFDKLSTTILFCLIVLNPWMMQHVAIGFSPFVTFSLFPYIIYSLISEYRLGKIIISSLLTGLIVYEGGLHLFNWLSMAVISGIFIHLLIFRNFRALYKIGIYYLLSLILIIPRLLIYFFSFKGYAPDINPSYNSIRDLIGILTDLDTTLLYKLPEAYSVYGTALYDGSLAMGKYFLFIFLFSLLLSVYLFIKHKNRLQIKTIVFSYIIIALFTIIGWNGVWNYLAEKINVLTSEKYPFRFLFIAVVMFLFLFIYQINCLKGKKKFLILALILPLLFNMYNRNIFFSKANSFVKINTDSSVKIIEQNSSLKNYFNNNIYFLENGNLKKPGSISPQKVEIPNINAEKIILPWLKYRYAKDFIFRSDTLSGYSELESKEENGEKVVLVTFKQKNGNNLKLIANDYNFKRNILLSILVYILIVWRLRKKCHAVSTKCLKNTFRRS